MALDINNPIGYLYDIYPNFTWQRGVGPVSTWYTYAQLQPIYSKAVGFYLWCGYTQGEIMSMDLCSIAVTDYFWRTSNILGTAGIDSTSAWPDAVYANVNGNTSRGRCILPNGRWYLRGTCHGAPGGQLEGEQGIPYVDPAYATLGSGLVIDSANWVGAPATPSGNFDGNAYLDRCDAVRTLNWGTNNYNIAYSPGFKVRNIGFYGDMRSAGTGYNDVSYSSTGVSLWDAGETSMLENCFFEFFNDYAIELARGTPATIINCSTFCNGLNGIMLTGSASMNMVRIFGGSADENPAWLGTRAGYGRAAGGIIHATGTKLEASGYNGSVPGESYKGIPPKGQMIFDGQGWVNLRLDSVSWQTIGCRVDSAIRLTNSLNVSAVNVDNLVTDFGGMQNFLQVGSTRYSYQQNPTSNPTLPSMSLRALNFKYNTSAGVWFSDQLVQTNGSSCSARLGFIVKDDATGTPTGAFNYSTCTPSWNPQTGFGTPPPPPPVPVLTTIVVNVQPDPILTNQTANASFVGYDQNGQVISTSGGSWSIVSGPATISTTGVVTPTGTAGTAIARYTIGLITGQDGVVINLVPPPPPAPPVATTLTVSLLPTSVSAGQTSQATVVTLDQYGAVFPSVGSWGIVSGAGASVNGSGLVSTTQAGNVVVGFTTTGGTPFGSAILAVQALPPPPPPPPNTLLYSIVFAGQNLQALPGCVALNGAPGSGQENWRQGSLSGANFSTFSAIGGNRATNTTQRFTTPIPNVRRVVLKGCVVRENISWRRVNDRTETTGSQAFSLIGTNRTPTIGTFVTNGGATDITITFTTAQTLAYLVGDAALNTLNFTCTGIEIYSNP